jgi:DMSO/TMAO reductase YedYZ molybdopterin-dependent catalytic subunit
MEPLGRRDFLRLASGAAAALALPSCGQALIRDSLHKPTPEDPLTSPLEWYINSYRGTQRVDLSRWRLSLEGLFDRPGALDLSDLRAFPPQRMLTTMMCVGNSPGGGLISSGEFTGARLRDVLDAAGLRSSARGILLLGADGFPGVLDIEDALADDALLAYDLGGVALPPEHGFPLRLVLPRRFGYRQPKWIVGIRALLRFPSVRVVSHAIDELVGERVPVVSRIDRPAAGPVPAGPTPVTGLAFSGAGAIVRVEVELDGAWRSATLTYNTPQDDLPDTLWSLWRADVSLSPGPHRLRVRAFDAAGRGQPETFDFPYPSDAVHAIQVTAA